MGRFHLCMPVVDGDLYCCPLCHRDMTAELRQYAVDAPSAAWGRPAVQAGDREASSVTGSPFRDLPATPGWD